MTGPPDTDRGTALSRDVSADQGLSLLGSYEGCLLRPSVLLKRSRRVRPDSDGGSALMAWGRNSRRVRQALHLESPRKGWAAWSGCQHMVGEHRPRRKGW